MENVGQTAEEEVEGTDLDIIGGKPTPWPREAESSEDFDPVEPGEIQRSHEVCLELCDDIRDVLLEIQREITGLFNVPRLRAVQHRHKLNGIYTNMEKLHADIADGK